MTSPALHVSPVMLSLVPPDWPLHVVWLCEATLIAILVHGAPVVFRFLNDGHMARLTERQMVCSLCGRRHLAVFREVDRFRDPQRGRDCAPLREAEMIARQDEDIPVDGRNLGKPEAIRRKDDLPCDCATISERQRVGNRRQ